MSRRSRKKAHLLRDQEVGEVRPPKAVKRSATSEDDELIEPARGKENKRLRRTNSDMELRDLPIPEAEKLKRRSPLLRGSIFNMRVPGSGTHPDAQKVYVGVRHGSIDTTPVKRIAQRHPSLETTPGKLHPASDSKVRVSVGGGRYICKVKVELNRVGKESVVLEFFQGGVDESYGKMYQPGSPLSKSAAAEARVKPVEAFEGEDGETLKKVKAKITAALLRRAQARGRQFTGKKVLGASARELAAEHSDCIDITFEGVTLKLEVNHILAVSQGAELQEEDISYLAAIATAAFNTDRLALVETPIRKYIFKYEGDGGFEYQSSITLQKDASGQATHFAKKGSLHESSWRSPAGDEIVISLDPFAPIPASKQLSDVIKSLYESTFDHESLPSKLSFGVK
jgi:hypothetical protein